MCPRKVAKTEQHEDADDRPDGLDRDAVFFLLGLAPSPLADLAAQALVAAWDASPALVLELTRRRLNGRDPVSACLTLVIDRARFGPPREREEDPSNGPVGRQLGLLLVAGAALVLAEPAHRKRVSDDLEELAARLVLPGPRRFVQTVARGLEITDPVTRLADALTALDALPSHSEVLVTLDFDGNLVVEGTSLPLADGRRRKRALLSIRRATGQALLRDAGASAPEVAALCERYGSEVKPRPVRQSPEVRKVEGLMKEVLELSVRCDPCGAEWRFRVGSDGVERRLKWLPPSGSEGGAQGGATDAGA